jgi:CRISPR-associated protein Cmr1
MKSQQINATFEIVTPMFLGDGDKEARIIRPQSFKAELLFWWRALHFSKFVDEAGGDQHAALQLMHKDEALLFGGVERGTGAKGKDKLRQAAFLLAIRHGDLPTIGIGKRLEIQGNGLVYIGYGLMDFKGILTRSCLTAGACFDVSIRFRRGDSTESEARIDRLKTQLTSALKVMGLLGGLGSRKRRGFGSIRLKNLTVFGEVEIVVPQTPDSFIKMIRSLVAGACSSQSRTGTGFSLSAFAADSHVRVTAGGKPDALECQNSAGEAFRLYRAWGQGGVIDNDKGVRSLENFEADHHWFKHEVKYKGAKQSIPAEWAIRAGNQLPERANFGLPHNYFKKDWGKLSVEAKGEGTGRRASPLLFHITKIGGKFHCVLTFFNTQFMPEPRLKLTDTTNGRKDLIPNDVDDNSDEFEPNPSVITDFLENKLRTAGKVGDQYNYLNTMSIIPLPMGQT